MIAALSVPEHCLSFYFVCDDQIQISCAVGLRKMENLAATLIGYLLTDGLNCLTVKYLAGWHLE